MSSNICWLCKLFREDENGISSNFIFKPRIRHTVNLNSNPTITFPLLQRVSLEEVLQWSQSFENLMTTKYGPVIYKTYLKTEYSDENIEFWLACETYKKIASRRKRISVARKMFKNYIQPLAPKEINIDSPAREAIIRNIQEPTQSCFDEAQRIVYMHMERDSYPRFLGSEIYQKLKHRFQIHSNDS